jgi:ubiquinone/menaquinone biosynthesis C-methylase UbiE
MINKVFLFTLLIFILQTQCSWIKAEFYVRAMDKPERLQRLEVDKVIATLSPDPNALIADIGAGSGVFTIPFGKVLSGKGRVFGVDINSHLLKEIEKRAKEANLTNVIPVLATDTDTGLNQSVDILFICDTLHNIPNPKNYLKSIKKNLKKGGRLAILDFKNNFPKGTKPFTVKELRGWAIDAGYTDKASN